MRTVGMTNPSSCAICLRKSVIRRNSCPPAALIDQRDQSVADLQFQRIDRCHLRHRFLGLARWRRDLGCCRSGRLPQGQRCTQHPDRPEEKRWGRQAWRQSQDSQQDTSDRQRPGSTEDLSRQIQSQVAIRGGCASR
jgi:hypothetical protein